MDINKIKAKIDPFLESKFVPLAMKIKVAAGVAILAALVAAFVFFVYSPKNKEIVSLEKKQVNLMREIAEAKARTEKLAQHKAEMKETELRFQQASILLPQTQEIPSLLTNISSLGANAGLDFLSFSPRGVSPQEFYAEIPIAISVMGPYHNIGNFLYQVSRLDRIVSVDNISLGGPSRVGGEMLLSASINLLTYKFIEQEAKK